RSFGTGPTQSPAISPLASEPSRRRWQALTTVPVSPLAEDALVDTIPTASHFKNRKFGPRVGATACRTSTGLFRYWLIWYSANMLDSAAMVRDGLGPTGPGMTEPSAITKPG